MKEKSQEKYSISAPKDDSFSTKESYPLRTSSPDSITLSPSAASERTTAAAPPLRSEAFTLPDKISLPNMVAESFSLLYESPNFASSSRYPKRDFHTVSSILPPLLHASIVAKIGCKSVAKPGYAPVVTEISRLGLPSSITLPPETSSITPADKRGEVKADSSRASNPETRTFPPVTIEAARNVPASIISPGITALEPCSCAPTTLMTSPLTLIFAPAPIRYEISARM